MAIIQQVVAFLMVVVVVEGIPPRPPLATTTTPPSATSVMEGSVQCFASSDCSGTPLSTTDSARECCVESDVSQYYMTSDSCRRCIVHGFRQWQYSVLEGKSVHIEFERDIKGQSRYPRLGVPLLGAITAKGEVEVETNRRGQANFLFRTNDDNTALENDESVKLTFRAFHDQFTEELESSGEFLRDMAYVNIVDNDVDPCLVGFTMDEYSVIESAGSVSVCVYLTCPNGKTNNISVEVYSDDTHSPLPLANGNFPGIEFEYARGVFDDYEQQIRGFNKMQMKNLQQGATICYDQLIYDDSRLEVTEYMGLILLVKETRESTVVQRGLAVIRIEDDDSGVVGLEGGYYFSETYGEFELCATWTPSTAEGCPFDSSLHVFLSFTDITTVYEADYTLLDPSTLYFENCQLRSCVTISIHNDEILEDLVEVFTVSLYSTPELNERLTFNPAETIVLIIDDDEAVISLDNYVIKENNLSFMVCTVLSSDPNVCKVAMDIDITLIFEDGTAIADLDYVAVSGPIRAFSCEPVVCRDVTIINDDTVETGEETFTVRLERTPTLDYRIQLDNEPASITITDDDVAHYGLQSNLTEMHANETEIEVCVEIKPPYNTMACPVDFKFDLYLSICDGEYLAFAIEPCTFEKCVVVSTGTICSFSDLCCITLEQPTNHDERIVLVDVEKNITCIPDTVPTVSMGNNSVTVSEGSGGIDVCVVVKSTSIDCPATFPIELNILTTDISAGVREDYLITNSTILLEPCQNEGCSHIEVIDDQLVENIELFTVSLTYKNSSEKPVIFSNETMDIIIDDDDEALIQLEDSIYTAREGQNESVSVCAVVAKPISNCPIDFGLKINARFGKYTFGFMLRVKVRRVCRSLPIENDERVEQTSLIPIELIRPDDLNSRIMLGGPGMITILDDPSDVAVVGLNKTSYSFSEEETNPKICIQLFSPSIDIPVDFTFSLQLDFLNNSAGENEDFMPVSMPLTLEPGETVKCQHITLINDQTVEQMESFMVTLSRPPDLDPRIRLSLAQAEIFITDSDEAVIGLERTSYTTLENNENFEICITVYSPDIDCPVIFPFDVMLLTTNGTAALNQDFQLTETFLRFISCSRRQCFDIVIIDDDIIEDVEMFNITLWPPPFGLPRRFTLSPNVTTVTIENDDMVIVTFDRPAYTVQETSGSPRVCVRVVSPSISCPVNAEFSVTLLIIENSSREDEDYTVTETSTRLEFAGCETVKCVSPFTIINDQKVEDVETFDLFIQSRDQNLVRADPNIAQVTILDDAERATVELTERSYTVTEGTDLFLFVCAAITTAQNEVCPVDFAFEITLDVGGDEFGMVFGKCQREKCLPVPINNDNRIENIETVTISLIRPTELDRRISVSSRRAILTIIDDPTDVALVGLERVQYIFQEEDTETDVCIRVQFPNVDTPISFPFSVLLTSSDHTAMSRTDYSTVAVRLLFNPGDFVKCQRVRLIDDRTQENNETFTITLSRTSGLDSRIQLVETEASILIIDTDPVEVGLERASYSVREDVGHVEVCVVVTSPTFGCPVAYNFSVLVVNLAGSAVPGSDYVNEDSTTRLVFGRCDRKHCASIRIIDNEVLEEPEIFFVRLFRNGPNDYFTVSRHSATVEITDDDVITVGFSQTEYQVEENGGLIRVCAELMTNSTSCVVPFSFFLTFTTQDGTADSPEDFTAVSESLRHSHCTNEVCALIPIINDDEVAGTERFIVILSGENLDQRITLRPTVATVAINDDDSARVFINEPRYFVGEGDRTIQVCVEVDSPQPVSEDCPVDFRISVTLVTTPDTADTSDYRSSSVGASIQPCGEVACGNIAITDDNILETAVETFRVSLADTNTDTRLRVVSDVFSTVNIRDNDEVTIGMLRISYTVAEGRQQSVCVTLNGRSAIANRVTLTTRQGTAETGDPSDFTSLSESLTFTPSSSNRLCIDVDITDDSVVEETEQFFVDLMRAQGLDRRATLIDTATTSEIFITDNDNARIKLNASSISVHEGETFQLCVLVNDNAAECGVAYDFDVSLTLSTSSPESRVDSEDYSGLTEIMNIPGCRNRVCVPVTIVDDRTVEREEKLIITMSENIGVIDSSRDNRVEITIHDNDYAFVRLYQDYQYVREDVGTASVCAVVDAGQAVAFEFCVNFVFTTDSATEDDFVLRDSIAVFRPEDIVPGRIQKGCAELIIINSVAVEMPESLGVRIELPEGTPDVIQLSPSMTEGTIDIFDDDSAVAGLTRNNYTFGTDSVRVCVSLTKPSGNCPITFPFDLVFRLASETSAVFEVDTSSFSDGEGIDIEDAHAYILLFNPCQREFCFDINLKDGVTRPGSGSFGISVARTPDHGRSTTLNPELTLGNIIVR